MVCYNRVSDAFQFYCNPVGYSICLYVDVHIITTTNRCIKYKYCAVVFYANKILIYHTIT